MLILLNQIIFYDFSQSVFALNVLCTWNGIKYFCVKDQITAESPPSGLPRYYSVSCLSSAKQKKTVETSSWNGLCYLRTRFMFKRRKDHTHPAVNQVLLRLFSPVLSVLKINAPDWNAVFFCLRLNLVESNAGLYKL